MLFRTVEEGFLLRGTLVLGLEGNQGLLGTGFLLLLEGMGLVLSLVSLLKFIIPNNLFDNSGYPGVFNIYTH